MQVAKKPYILALDDDPAVLRAVERDLRAKYSARYRIVSADAPAKALDLVRQLTTRGDRVALFVVDQRMPGMSGTEFLALALELQPLARRVLLTAYADSQAAIDAINKVKLNHYLTKPWEPPEQHLYPVLDDLLDDWHAHAPESFDGVQIIGTRWAPATHRLKDFLAKSQVPYRWTEPGQTDDPRWQAALGDRTPVLPAVLFADGTLLENPATDQMAEKLGLARGAQRDFYDVIIVGAGPAGLASALYCSTEGLRNVLVEKEAAGGQAGLSSRIENYLGFPSGLSGADLARRGLAQVQRFGTELIAPAQARSLRVEGDYRIVTLASGQELAAHAVVLACGVQWRRLATPGMERLTGAGVYYGAATTEATSCKDEEVFVVGGANSAGQAAVHFAQYARRVTMLVRADSLSKSMSRYLIDRIGETPNIHVEVNAEIEAVDGDERLRSIRVKHHDTGVTEERAAAALFIFIGAEPHTEWLNGTICRDGKGFIPTGKRTSGWPLKRDPYLLETSVPGVFAVGDVRDGAVRRVANSVGEGSVVLYFIHQYLANR